MLVKDRTDPQTFQSLFKYKPIDIYLYELLIDGSLYFANRTKLNDPDEAVLHFERGYASVDGMYFTCLSTKGDDHLLWSHYAGGHSGVCLEFDFGNAVIFQDAKSPYKIENEVDEGAIWVDRVRYGKEFPRYLQSPDGESNLTFEEKQWFGFHKLTCWQSENEVRLRMTINEGSERSKIGKEGKKWKFRRSRLRAVYFGLRVQEPQRKLIMQLAKNHGYSCSFSRAVDVCYQQGENRHVVCFRRISEPRRQNGPPAREARTSG